MRNHCFVFFLLAPVFLVSFFFFPVLKAEPAFEQVSRYCSQNWACAGVDKSAMGFAIWMANEKAWPITMTLDLTTKNLQDNTGKRDDFEFTRVLAPNSKIVVTDLRKITPAASAYRDYRFKWTVGDMYAQHNNSVRYQLPYAKGETHYVVQGYNGGYSHRGASRYALDFMMKEGTPVHAAREGVVVDVTEKHNRGGADPKYAKYANFVVILHSDGTTGEYYHLQHRGAAVEVGDNVTTGQLIGYSGNTGFSSLPHLHFAVYRARPNGGYESIKVDFAEKPKSYFARGE